MNHATPSKKTRRAVLVALGAAIGGGLAGNAHGQQVFEQLLRVLRERAMVGIGGYGRDVLADPEYVASVLQQIVSRNRDETTEPSWMLTDDAQRGRIGTVTVLIDIASNGQLLGVSYTATTGQGRALVGRAINAVKRAAPFGRPVPLNRDLRSGNVKIEETFLIQDSGRWNLQSVIESARAKSADRP